MKTYVIYPDKTMKEFDEWPEHKKDVPMGSYVYQPEDITQWVKLVSDWGSMTVVSYKQLPDYCKMWSLLIPNN